VVTPSSVYDYEYQYDAFDGGGQVVNSANGIFRVTPNAKSFLSHNSTRLPTLVPFTIDDANALYMDIRYRPAGSTGAYTSVPRLSRPNNATQFKWDASAITPATGTTSYEYEYKIFDGAGNPVLNPLGQAIVVLGTVTVGTAPAQAATTGWVITGLESTTALIRRYQTHNAFGEVDSETDGRGFATNLAYSTLGLLTQRLDPTTDVTAETGLTTRARPDTRWYYDRTGKAVATRDANLYVTAQQWNDGFAEATIAKEFHVDGGKPSNLYDVFGNLRIATDGENRQTRYTYDGNNLLTRLDRPTRGAGEYLSGQASWETYEYDVLGQRIATTNTLGRARTYYDLEGRVSKVTSIEGRNTTYAYTYYNFLTPSGGWQKKTTDLGGMVSYEDKDVFGRMTWRRDFGGHDTTYTYNYAGWLTAQSSTLSGGAPLQNLSYEYYNNGYLKRQTDNAYHLQTDFVYDVNGNRTFEGYKQIDIANAVYNNSTVTYDELNRVKTVVDPKYEIRYKYDAVGNRRNVFSYYNDGLDGNKQTQDYWYLYDGMNRFVVTMGQISGGAISRGTTGKLIAYDKASQRKTAEYYDAASTNTYRERYTYTADGYLQDMFLGTWNGSSYAEQSQAASARSNDLQGRVVAFAQRDSSNALITNVSRTFDRDNRQTLEVDSTKVYNSAFKTDTYAYNTDGTLASINTSNVQVTLSRTYLYQWWDSAKQTELKVKAATDTLPDWAPGTSKLVYDVNGNLSRATDVKGKRTVQYITDMDGQILVRQELAARQGVPSDWNSATLEVMGGDVTRKRNYYYLNSQRIGDVTNEGQAPSGLDYAEALAQTKARANDEKNKKFAPTA
jgi:YD repeat-containing protein